MALQICRAMSVASHTETSAFCFKSERKSLPSTYSVTTYDSPSASVTSCTWTILRTFQGHGPARGIDQGRQAFAIALDWPNGDDLPVSGAGSLEDSFLVNASESSEDFEWPNLVGGHVYLA